MNNGSCMICVGVNKLMSSVWIFISLYISRKNIYFKQEKKYEKLCNPELITVDFYESDVYRRKQWISYNSSPWNHKLHNYTSKQLHNFVQHVVIFNYFIPPLFLLHFYHNRSNNLLNWLWPSSSRDIINWAGHDPRCIRSEVSIRNPLC